MNCGHLRLQILSVKLFHHVKEIFFLNYNNNKKKKMMKKVENKGEGHRKSFFLLFLKYNFSNLNNIFINVFRTELVIEPKKLSIHNSLVGL